MSITAAGLSIGLKVSQIAFKIWAKDSVVADVAPDLGELISRNVPDLLAARRTERQFNQIAEHVASRLGEYIQREWASLDEGERNAATLAVGDTLTAADVDAAAVIEANLDPLRLEQSLRGRDPKRVDNAMLSESGASLYDVLLAEACRYICEIAHAFPTFQTDLARTMLQREGALIEMVTQLLEGIPAPRVPTSWGTGSEDSKFETRYLQSLASRLDVLQLFGVDLPSHLKKYSLSVAYISLTATTGETHSSAASNLPSSLRAAASSKARAKVSVGQDLESDEDDAKDADEFVRVEAALGRGSRVLVGGQAGSGKSTLLQWLAVSACRSGFAGELEDWNRLVPFRVQLRRYVEDEFPTPGQFVAAELPVVAEVMPDGWVHRVMAENRALLLVDGIDELPPERRSKAREWLEGLLAEFPDMRAIVTSRTIALTSDWFESEGFRYSELLPMQMADMRAFVGHWHNAAVDAVTEQNEKDDLERAARHMLTVLRDNLAIRNLCTSPLLCALICALHRDKINKLPQSRMELYDTALRMLLVRRDLEREIDPAAIVDMSFAQRQALLQDFALWLLENNASDATENVFRSRIEKKSAFLHNIEAPTEAIATDLLLRSGVLRRPVEGRVDFVHRTFLEYLAASALVEDEAIEKIILHAHHDQWREVVLLAVGHATRPQRERLIRGIVARGEKEAQNKHRLFLLAVACLETAPELDPVLVEKLSECLEAVMPPINMTQAAAVASAGHLAIPQLRGRKYYAVEAAACVRALATIGGDDAFDALKEVADETRVTVVRQLIRAWPQFDPEPYAREVLARSPLDDGYLEIADPTLLPLVPLLTHLKRLNVDCPGRLENLRLVGGLEQLVRLDASATSGLQDLTDLAFSENLRVLYVRSCRDLRTLAGIEGLGLQRLDAAGSSSLVDISSLRAVPRLRFLNVSGTAVRSLDVLSETENFLVSAIATGLPLLEQVREPVRAKHLSLTDCPRLRDVRGLEDSEGLLSLHLAVATDLDELALPSSLTEISFMQQGRLSRSVSFSGDCDLSEFTYWGALDRQTSEWLGSMKNLTNVAIDGFESRDAAEAFLRRTETQWFSAYEPRQFMFDLDPDDYGFEAHPLSEGWIEWGRP